MISSQIRRLRQLYFTYQDLADALRIAPESARVSCHRYVRSGDLIRLKRNYYILRERWEHLNAGDFFVLANLLQVPSYVSFTSALVHFGYTTQVQQDFIESASLKRSAEIQVQEFTFRFTKIKKEYYSNFLKQGNFFIATPEKALMDAVYMDMIGRYHLDTDSIDFGRFNKEIILKIGSRYPERIRRRLKSLCAI
jgi:predicted transcriptional regulator of viral defense system